jgi:DNA repair photolyase
MAGSIKGRGAADSPQGRFERLARDAEPDDHFPEIDPARPRTTITITRARSILSHNDSPDVGFNQSINPYQGCEHGCIYCFARPSHSYLDLSPGLDFETKLFAKENAAQLLRAELSRPGYRCQVTALGVNTDCYQPIERDKRITREILEVLWEFRHPVAVVTKSSLIERDLDILGPMAAEGLAHVSVTITTLDAELARNLEPRAPAPYRRVEAVRRLSAAGVPVSVLVAPVIPFLNDKDLERILEAAKDAGAKRASYVILRLPHELKGLFKDWLERHYPLKAEHIMARIRDLRGGREYDSTYGTRMSGVGEYAQLLERRFDVARRRLGFDDGDYTALETGKFRSASARQGTLF